MENQFDELAKAIAGGMNRRDALRRVGGGLIGAALASLGIGKAWSAPGTGGLNGRGGGCGVSCQRAGVIPGTAQFPVCTAACEACKDSGGTPVFGTGGVVGCTCPTGQTACNNVCCPAATPPQVCYTGGTSPTCKAACPVEPGRNVSTTQPGACSGANPGCACPKDSICCQGTGTQSNTFLCCTTGHGCAYHSNGQPACL